MSAAILTPVVGVPSTIPPSKLSTLTGVATYDGPYIGGPTGLGIGSMPFKWDISSNGWVTMDPSPTALALPVARGDILNSAAPTGWLVIDLTWQGLDNKNQKVRLQLRPAAGANQTIDLSVTPTPLAYTTPQQLIDLMNGADAARIAADAARAAANTAAGTATTAAGTATAAAAAADTARTTLTSQVTAALLANTAALTTSLNNAADLAGAKLYASTTERNADAAANGTWGRSLSDNTLARREAGAWVVRGSAGGVIPLTRTQRQALTPLITTQVLETDTHLAVTYYVGTGWRRDGDGGDPDFVAPPPTDTGDFT
ncbi:hypothetical protein [Deinococcus ruber]|uniref:Uncharacterized protein n=1 Tax=Deinococcus ruber TaxID=1848197 RepID=A0A918CCA4_9DEIO|nr:hypothetical protein [Deinococcus ruber]GGR16899.1 hypothetical protein GCM10008957_31920 [Deinococcus ruber]